MPYWTSSESRVISGRVEYFCKCNRQLTLQTAKTRKNPGKRFVTCSKCNVYDFLDDDLLSEYYKELLYRMFQKKKQVINVLVVENSRLEEELRATKSKLKLYDSLPICLQPANAFFQLANAFLQPTTCKCKVQMLACKLQMQDNLQMLACKLQMQANLQMLA
ncbi:hypothetical protein Tco_1340317 [Tanacetum coccineum]